VSYLLVDHNMITTFESFMFTGLALNVSCITCTSSR